MKFTKEQKKEFRSLLKEYGYDQLIKKDKLKSLCRDFEFWNDDPDVWTFELTDLANLLLLLRKCKGNKIQLSGTISHPSKGECKNQIKKIFINSQEVINNLESLVNALLFEYSSGFRTSEEDTNYEAEAISYLASQINPITEKDCALYMDFDLKTRKMFPSAKGNAFLGRKLYTLEDKMYQEGVFGNTERGNKQKEYCFLYDYVVIAKKTNALGKGYTSVLGKEKYTNVKNWITAYEKLRNFK